MTINESLLPEYDQEIVGVRRTLERVPMAPPPPPADTAELVATLDKHAAEARAAIAGASDAELLRPWSLLTPAAQPVPGPG